MLCDMFLTTNFMTLILICVWRVPLLFAAAFYFFAAPIEGVYLSSTVQKIPTGTPNFPPASSGQASMPASPTHCDESPARGQS